MADKLLSLAPKTDLDPHDPGFKAYCDHLDAIYRDCTMRNIAIIGNRGSGKSSIIRSYDRRNNNGVNKFLYVSLVDFENHENDDHSLDMVSSNDVTQKRLEYSLLCQILAHCSKDTLMGSSLRNIPQAKRPPQKRSKIQSFLLYLFCSLVFILCFEEQFGAILTVLNIAEKYRILMHGSGLFAAFTVGFILLMKALPRIGNEINLSKMTFKTPHGEAEWIPNGDKYCLDRFKFELIHILDQLSAKISYTVVFEDMERINSDVSREIMTKLRELNTLTNTHRATLRPNSIPVRFIYALSDDVFDYEFRTKFFDTIMPVIPALNAKNVRFTLESTLENAGIAVDRKLILIISPYVTDYRTLRNIVSEFFLLRELYYATHLETEWDIRVSSKILALATYKSLFPQKYAYAFSEEGDSILPHLTETEFPKKYVLLVRELYDESFLDWDTLSLVGCYSVRRMNRYSMNVLENGSSDEKAKLLRELLAVRQRDLRSSMFQMQLFENERDPYIAGLMGEYLFDHPSTFIYQVVCGNPNMTQRLFVNSLAYLSNFDINYLRSAIHPLVMDNVSQWFVKYLVDYPLTPPDQNGWYRAWNYLWDKKYAYTLIVCLGKSYDKLSTTLLRKKLGQYELGQYIARYKERFLVKTKE